MKVKYVRLPFPLFIASKNFKDSIDAKDQLNTGVQLDYDEEAKYLKVSYKGEVAHFPNFAGYVIEGETIKSPEVIIKPIGKIKAQASTPAGIRND